MLRKSQYLALLLITLLAAGCATLDPTPLPAEYTPPPVAGPLWNDLAAAAPDDWHVLLDQGPDALDWRLRAIDSAVDNIDLQTFLWASDTAGSMVLDHLLRAAERGVSVRVLIDDSFLMREDALLLALAAHPNIEYRVFNPFGRRAGGAFTRQLLNLAEFGRLDHRMHNKSMVIDNRVAIVGGRNLADEYFGLHTEANFRDLEILLGGAVVREVSTAFDAYWNDRWTVPIEVVSHAQASPGQLAEARRVTAEATHLHREETPAERHARWLAVAAGADLGAAVLFVDEPPDENPNNPDEAPVQVANELVKMFHAAQTEVVIVSAYLIPTPRLEDAVKQAVERGVRVRILTNSIGSNNHVTAHAAYRKHVDTLLTSGAELHEVRTDADSRQRYMLTPVESKKLALHAKAMIIDNDKVFIGSANLDPRSLRINTEMGFLITSEPFNAAVRNAVEGDFAAENAWRLDVQDGAVVWISDDATLTAQPALSFMQRVEDWFFTLLPIEDEM